jgi:hypothetical protein
MEALEYVDIPISCHDFLPGGLGHADAAGMHMQVRQTARPEPSQFMVYNTRYGLPLAKLLHLVGSSSMSISQMESQ